MRRPHTSGPRALAALAALLLLATSPAAAHGEHAAPYSEEQALAIGGLEGRFELVPGPVYAGDSAMMRVQLGDPATRGPKNGLTVEATLSGPDDRPARDPRPLPQTSNGTYERRFTFDEPGDYRVTLAVREGDGNPSLKSLDFRVYPAFPVRIVPANPTFEFEAETPLLIGFYAVDPAEGRSVQAPDDLKVRIEQLDAATGETLEAAELPTEWREGAWAFNWAFAIPGDYGFRFASETMGFTYDETPMAKTTVHPAPPGPPQTRPSPDAGLALLVVGLAAAAALVTTRKAR